MSTTCIVQDWPRNEGINVARDSKMYLERFSDGCPYIIFLGALRVFGNLNNPMRTNGRTDPLTAGVAGHKA